MDALIFLVSIVGAIASIVYVYKYNKAVDFDHADALSALKPVRTMTEEDCEYFQIYYGKNVSVGDPVYLLRGDVVCHITRYNGNEFKEYTIAEIKIDRRCERDLQNKGIDLYSYVEDEDFLSAEIAPLIETLNYQDLPEEEENEIIHKIASIEDEHIGVNLEFTFLNSAKTQKPAFITGIDLWNINPKRVQGSKKQKIQDEIVSFDIA